ncbi:hypothetical protein AAH991_22150 [Microbispora sp. ZYX-F-249]|uniref:Uncharacterized protein n=1 Tax=Microbispora maris TaxID=3144104 RepID=A0ABV0ARD4_9ACTN
MRGAGPAWGGAGVAVAALAALGVYLSQVGLDKTDKLAGVIGLFAALAGLRVAVYGLVAERGQAAPGDPAGVSQFLLARERITGRRWRLRAGTGRWRPRRRRWGRSSTPRR